MIEEGQQSYIECGRKNVYALSEYILGRTYLKMVQRSVPISLSTVVKNIGFLIKNIPFADREAQNHFNKAIGVAMEVGAKGTLGTTYLDLGLLHKVKGRDDKARETLSEAIKVFEQCEIEFNLRKAQEEMASLK
jgi:hypothetical protein